MLSKFFGRRSTNTAGSPEPFVLLIQDDEEVQNSLLSDDMRLMMGQNPPSDEIPGAVGTFGYSPTNPIPVNGPIGEIAYLSKLRTNGGERLLFHRVGSVKNAIDQYEAVTFSGSEWFTFYLTMYYPKRSRRAPEGFNLVEGPCTFTGFAQRSNNFPYDFVERVQESKLRDAYLHTPDIQALLKLGDFNR